MDLTFYTQFYFYVDDDDDDDYGVDSLCHLWDFNVL